MKRNALFLLDLKPSESGLKTHQNDENRNLTKFIIDVYPQLNEIPSINVINNEEFNDKISQKRNSSMILDEEEEENENNLIKQQRDGDVDDDEVSFDQ